jgi:site-specific recombinase XerD
LSQPQAAQLLASFQTWRDRAIADLMLYCGLRSCEVLALKIADVDLGGRWLQVVGKGNRERRVPLDGDVASVIQVYLLAERPQTSNTNVFIVAKGPSRGQPLTTAGLRTIFRYHREISGIGAGHPHALRHTFGDRSCQGGGRSGGDAGATRACSRRYQRPLHPSRSHSCEGRVRCRS